MTHTVRQLSERYGVSIHTILAWIAAGELRAVNVAPRQGGRPQWRISDKALDEFERLRTPHVPDPQPRPRKLATSGERY